MNTVKPDLLEILVCPENKSSLHEADQDLLERINAGISVGKVKNRGGETVAQTVSGGLVREDGKFLYPVRDSIPIMLIEEAIALDTIGESNE